MRFGFVVPWGDAKDIAELAAIAEEHHWDGLFVWETLYGVDAWVSLTAAAARTESIRLGTMLTPLSRRKPWELAGQVATLDRFSAGRTILGVGLGAPDTGFAEFGEEVDRRIRAELLDEGLEIVKRLWTGVGVEYSGKHYQLTPSSFPKIGTVVQRPNPPIWCVGALGSNKSMARALKCNGLIPQTVAADGARQASLAELSAAMPEIRRIVGDQPYDIVIEGSADEHSPAAWQEIGATWWVESMWDAMHGPDPVEAAAERLRLGPPPLA